MQRHIDMLKWSRSPNLHRKEWTQTPHLPSIPPKTLLNPSGDAVVGLYEAPHLDKGADDLDVAAPAVSLRNPAENIDMPCTAKA
jgi:hypothetical protein